MINDREKQQIFKRLKSLKPKRIDDLFHDLHEKVFEETDCLACGNCCKTTSPMFFEKDIERLADFLKIKPGSFVSKYLRIDEDGDYVLHSSPCPFLGSDNYCIVYDARPKACREYPHTDRKNILGILKLTEKNTEICPAVLKIVEELGKVI